MPTPESAGISVVLPTYNRGDALSRNLPSLLGIQGVDEIIVVVDGSSDSTDEVLAAIIDSRLRVVRHPRNRGVSAARNTGVQAARGSWVLFGEDDCRFPPDYALVLLHEAERLDAALVGAPMLHVRGNDEDARRQAASAPRVDHLSTEIVSVFPSRPVETPFVPATVLVRRSVFDEVRFDEDYQVNSYREETDFFVCVARAGHRCIFTPATYAWQLETWGGGNHTTRAPQYEYWALRNNWRFLRRHGRWLSEQGYITSASLAQAAFVGDRLNLMLRGAVKARAERMKRALG
jgi:glycosyltransferase involved in cell wall biosynthesis